MQFRKGILNDAQEIGKLYDSLCDYLHTTTNYPGWVKGCYPTIEDAMKGIQEGSLYVAIHKGQIVGSAILRHKPEAGYSQATWGIDCPYNDIYVIYTLAVHPDFLQAGIGSAFMEFIEDTARKEQMKAIRLDVVANNLPAIHLYEKHGFSYVDTVDLGYGEFGLDWFRLYEKLL